MKLNVVQIPGKRTSIIFTLLHENTWDNGSERARTEWLSIYDYLLIIQLQFFHCLSIIAVNSKPLTQYIFIPYLPPVGFSGLEFFDASPKPR